MADLEIPDAALAAYGRAYDIAFLASRAQTADQLARAETDAIRAGLAAAYPHLAAHALREALGEVRAVAARLEAKAKETGNRQHYGTAAGVRMAAVKLIELADGLFAGTQEADRG